MWIGGFTHDVDVEVRQAPRAAAVKARALIDVSPAFEQRELRGEARGEGIAQRLSIAPQHFAASVAAPRVVCGSRKPCTKAPQLLPFQVRYV